MAMEKFLLSQLWERPSFFTPQEPLFPPDTPDTDLVAGAFMIDMVRAIPDQQVRSELEGKSTTVYYRIHRRTNFAEVTFRPPLSKITHTLHVREVGYDGPETDAGFAAQYDPKVGITSLPFHLRMRISFINDATNRLERSPASATLTEDEYMAEHAALIRRFGQLAPHPSRPKVLTYFPLMDEEQRVNMVETVLVSLFEYMIDICAMNPCSVLDYAAQHCHKPVCLITSLMAYIGFLHQLACKCLLDLRWAGPAGELQNFTYERPVSVPFYPYHGFLEKAFMLKDLGLRVVRNGEFDVVPQTDENMGVAHVD